jgi:hypothetical protein
LDLRGPQDRVWLLKVFLRGSWPLVLLLFASSSALGATRFRTTLDDASAVGAELSERLSPRRIRSTLDDASAAFPLDAAPPRASASARLIRLTLDEAPTAHTSAARRIRLTLDEGQTVYGPLTGEPSQARRVRTTLE